MRSRASTRGSKGIDPVEDDAMELREVESIQRKRPRQRQQQQQQLQQRKRTGAKSSADRHAALDEHVRESKGREREREK